MILLVLFCVAMFAWLLNALGAFQLPRADLLAWVSVFLLFLITHGPISLR